MIKEVLDKHGLKYFNDTVNERLKNRLKYKGKFTLLEDQEDWDKLAPTHIGDIYLLAGDEVITIDDNTYKAGEWVVVMNETRLNDDDEVVDESGAETHVKIEKLGSASLPDAEDDGDGLAFVDGEWVIQKNYGYYKPAITKYEFAGKIPPPIMPIPVVFPDSHALIAGNKYIVSINDTELGEFTAEEIQVFDETQVVLSINTDGWNRISYENGALRMTYDSSHANEEITASIEGEFEGDYIKFDKRYIEAELPEDAEDADAMVYQETDGKGWITTPWYAYYKRGYEDYEGNATFVPNKNEALLLNLGDLIHGNSYIVNIDGVEYKGEAYDYGDKTTTILLGIAGYEKIYSRDGLAYLVAQTSSSETKTVHVEITGERLGEFRTFDQRYIDGMADGEDDGDGLAFNGGKWKKQPNYGYYTPGLEGYYKDGYVVGGRRFELVDFSGLIENQRYSGHIGGNWFNNSYPVRNADNKLQIYLDNGWNRLYQDIDGKWYVEANNDSFDGNTVDVWIEGELYGEYHQFDKRYIPPSVSMLETQAELPAVRDDSYRNGDLFYVKKDTTNVEVSRYSITEEAAADGWLILPSIGLEIPHTEHFITWEMLGALNEEERSKLIQISPDSGSIYRAVLTDGTIQYGFYYTEGGVDINYFASKTLYVYNKDTDSFVIVYSEVPSYDKHTPIECNFITDLTDNLFDE